MPKKRLNNHQKTLKLLFGFIDILAIIFSLLIASILVNMFTTEEVIFDYEFIFVALVVLITWLVMLKLTNLARIPRTSPLSVLFGNFVKLSFFGGLIILLLDIFIKSDSFPALTLATFTVLSFIILFIIRLVSFKTIKQYRANGHNIRNIAIIASEESEPIISKILEQKEWGFRILHVITDSKKIENKFAKSIKIHPKNVNIKSLLRYDIIDELICFDCKQNPEKFFELINFCSDIGVTVRVQGKKQLTGYLNTRIQYLGDVPFLTIENNPTNRFQHVVKSVVEVTASFTILFFLSPILFIIGLLLKISSRGPIVYKQERVGLRGRKFYSFKFRTTKAASVDSYGVFKSSSEHLIKNNSHLTLVGKFLKKTRFENIPQLINVINGEMSLIGPRSPLQDEVDNYQEWQLKRLAVKPGLITTWQLTPINTDIKSENPDKIDIQYIDNWSLKSDVGLFLKTFKTVLFAKGA